VAILRGLSQPVLAQRCLYAGLLSAARRFTPTGPTVISSARTCLLGGDDVAAKQPWRFCPAPADAQGGARLSPYKSVLIIDSSADSRQVFRLALENGRHRVLEADDAQQALDLVRREHPDVIVLDVEDHTQSDSSLHDELARSAQTSQTPIVVLATARRQAASVPGGVFVSKPYDYAPLIRRIEDLLASAGIEAA